MSTASPASLPEITVGLALGEDPVAPVVHIPTRALRVSTPAGHVPDEHVGRTWDSGTLTVGPERHGLVELTVRRAEHGDHEDHVVVDVSDAASKAVLWDVYDGFGRDRPTVEEAAGAEPTYPGGVPAQGRYTEEARRRRLAWIREHSGAALETFEELRVDPRRLVGNVENLVGTVEVPVGLAGPLLFVTAECRLDRGTVGEVLNYGVHEDPEREAYLILTKWAQILDVHTVIEQPYVKRAAATVQRLIETETARPGQ